MIHLQDWCVRRGAEITIGPFDFELGAGEVCTWMGPSGVGKTTFLLSLLGYQDTDFSVTGRRTVHSRALGHGETIQGALYIPQKLPFNPNWEIEAFLCRLPWGDQNSVERFWPTTRRRRRRVQKVLADLGLASRSRATLAELSGGEAQRAALAQMLLLKPQIMVADEFVSSLDPGMTVWILDLCRSLLRKNNASLILALHDVKAALHVSDKIMLIWPRRVCEAPWEISYNGSWRVDAIHTLLCLSRWFKDLDFSLCFRSLANFARRWLIEGLAPAISCAHPVAERVFLLDARGELRVAEDAVCHAVAGELSTDVRSEFNPVRVDVGDQTLIGLSGLAVDSKPVTVLI